MSAEGNLRKSKRQHVPNPIYSDGINALKKESNNRSKKKPKNAEEDLPSISEEVAPNYGYSTSFLPPVDCKEPFLPCVMPRGHRLDVQFVVQAKPKEVQKKKEIKVAQPPLVKPNKQAANLLSMFQKAIEDADINEQNQEEDSLKQPLNYETPKPQIVQKPKRVRDASEGSIQHVTIASGEMQIKHSILGEVTIPVDWQEPAKKEVEDGEVAEMRKKLEGCKLLKNISILMA